MNSTNETATAEQVIDQKKGFKKTKLGWIPNEWRTTTIKKAMTLINGFAFKPSDWKANGLPIIRIQNLNDPNAPFNYYDSNIDSKYLIRAGDILFAWSGTKGVSFGARIWDREDAYLNQHIYKVLVNESILSAHYGYLVLKKVQDSIERQAHGFKSSFVHVKKSDLEKILLPLPPLPEQQKIAEILSTWDEAIEKLQQLIAAKEKCKKALMQQLLTGEKRFKEFDGQAWSEVRLGDVFKERKETDRPDLNLLSITSSEGVVDRESVDRRDTSNEDKSKYKRIAPGDIGYNTMRLWQGVASLSTLEGIVSPAYTIVTPKPSVSGAYISYLFKLPRMINTFYRHSQGLVDDTRNCKYSHFEKIKVRIPKLEEQQKIASVLQTADQEIQTLNKKLEAFQQQKKGLMQQLLTGKVRVV